MKMIMVSLTLFLSTITAAHAIDQESINTLKKQGLTVRMGELTGAGSKLSLSRLAGFIHPNGIVMKEDCQAIAVSENSDRVDPKVSDVTRVSVAHQIINAREFEGFFTRD